METGRIFSPEEFHDPTEVGIDLKREVNDYKTNTRINQILNSPPEALSGKEIEGLIADRNVQLYKARHPERFFDSALTDTAMAQYEKQLLGLKKLKEDLEFKASINPGRISRIKKFFKK